MKPATVVILRLGEGASGDDEQGNPVPTEPVRIPIRRRGRLPAFAPGPTNEASGESGPRTTSEGRLFIPPGATVLPADRFEIDGDPGWLVDGDAGDWYSNAMRRPRGTVVYVKRST